MSFPDYPDPSNIGKLAPVIAKRLWPGLTLVRSGSTTDMQGTDGFLNGKRVQIKGDVRIEQSQNIYHEIYKKSTGAEDQKWRHSPSNAYYYIFVTRGFVVLTTIHALATLEIGMKLQLINPTSIGFLIPLSKLEERQVKEFDLQTIVCHNEQE